MASPALPKTGTSSCSIEASNLNAVPSKFNTTIDPTALTPDSLPVIDFSALITDDQDRRSKALYDLSAACREWGFFIIVNHGVPETLMKEVFAATKEFMSLPASEKKQYEAKSNLAPIRYGNITSSDSSNKTFTFWMNYFKLAVHPEFHCPQQPQLLRETLKEYIQRTREVVIKLIEAVCEALELDRHCAYETLKLDSITQTFSSLYYPPCPHPDQAIGLPPHTDPGLLTLLIHNGVAGLQIEHDGQWYNAISPQNSILVNVADQLVVFTNGRYKSVKHRAVVNKDRERVSVVVGNGPSAEAVVAPAAPLVEKDGCAKYDSIKYKDYLESLMKEIRT